MIKTFSDIKNEFGGRPCIYNINYNSDDISGITDSLCRYYNNTFGLFTITHMSMHPTEKNTRVITGRVIETDEGVCDLLYSSIRDKRKFFVGGDWVPVNLSEWLYKMGLEHKRVINNGGRALYIIPCPPEHMTTSAPSTYTTEGSKIPHPTSELLVNTRDINVFNECFNNNDVKHIIESLNSSNYIKGDNWFHSAGRFMCEINNKIVTVKGLSEYLNESLEVNDIHELFGTLQHAVIDTWDEHLNASQHNVHVILDDFYKELPEKVDELIEHWMGIYGKVGKYKNVIEYDADPIKYLETLRELVRKGRDLFKESELQSDVDDILGLIDSTLYKLKELTK